MKLLPVAPLSELAEGMKKTLVIEGRTLLLLCEQQCCFLIDSHCPHMGSRLDVGKVATGTIQCPHHLYKFDLSSGECLTRGAFCRRLRTLPLVRKDGWLKLDASLLADWS